MLKIHKYGFSPRKFIQLRHSRKFSQAEEFCRKPCPTSYSCKRPVPDPDIEKWLSYFYDYVHPLLRCPKHKDYRPFKNLFLFICLPLCACMYFVNRYMQPKKRRPKFIMFEYLRIRNKPFPWDPEKSLFHNSYYNALPNGYEYEVPEEEEYDPRAEECK